MIGSREMRSKIKAVLGILHGSRAFGGPVQVNLRLTNRCNLRCIHCYYNSPYLDTPAFPPLRRAKQTGQDAPSRNEMEQMLSLDADPGLMKTVVEDLLRMGTRGWQIGGNGEPFLYKDIMELIGILKASGSHCLANTNGTLINFPVADELMKTRFDELRITTMAGTPDVYVRTHPGATGEIFHKLKETLMYIAEQKAALKVKQPEITLAFIVIAQNYDSVFEFAEFAADVGADRVLFRPVDDIEDPGLANTVPTEKQAISVLEQLREVRLFFESRGVRHNIGYFSKIFRKQLNTEMLYRHIPCYYGWLSTLIDTDFKVYPCCRCYEPLGDIHENKFSEIWNGKSYRQFRKDGLYLNREKKSVSGCDCYSCVHHTANLRVYQKLHLIKSRALTLNNVSSFGEMI
jgi:MoaA/NifB/PqqE/SkfB family radical SAM enzyme